MSIRITGISTMLRKGLSTLSPEVSHYIVYSHAQNETLMKIIKFPIDNIHNNMIVSICVCVCVWASM